MGTRIAECLGNKHRWNKDGRCSCGAERCGKPIHSTRGGLPCAKAKPCRYHEKAAR